MHRHYQHKHMQRVHSVHCTHTKTHTHTQRNTHTRTHMACRCIAGYWYVKVWFDIASTLVRPGMIWRGVGMVLVWDEWYRRGAAKQPITGRMDESKTNQDISVKLNLARPWVYIWQRERDDDLSKTYILVCSSLIHNSSQTKACSGKSWQDIFLGWSEERRANELTKAKAQFDSRVK